MHIPDGYLGPQTFVPAYAVMVPLWAAAAARVRREVSARRVPLLALGAAFSFLIMLFNVPIPGGSSGHAVGAVLVAILLGPWAAMIAVSLALALQALLFHDGGIAAFGANCLTMAVAMPWVGWWTYRLLAGRAPAGRRQVFAAAAAGYLGLNVAALLTAVLFGLQPLLAHNAAGQPLFAPYPLALAVPVMMGEHLLVFGWVEALVTGLVLGYLQRSAPELLPAAPVAVPARVVWRRLALALSGLALLSPLGLYLPARFGAGTAWGEWSAGELQRLLGYVPAGMARAVQHPWQAPLPGYALPGHPGWDNLVYIISALGGMLILGAVVLGLRRWGWKHHDEATAGLDAAAPKR